VPFQINPEGSTQAKVLLRYVSVFEAAARRAPSIVEITKESLYDKSALS
jgi:hypothetical protein